MGLFDRIDFTYSGYSSTPVVSNSYDFSFGRNSLKSPLFNFNGGGNSYYFGGSYTPYFATPSSGYNFSSLSSETPTLGSLTSTRYRSLEEPAVLKRGSRKYCGKGSEYGSMSKNFALQKARNDSRLEFIGNGGQGWSISNGSFINDIKYATAGTSKVLDDVVSSVRKTDPNFSLLVTSALGTASSPHSKKAGHYNVDSVKLDFGGGMSKAQATKVAKQLYATGKFDFADPECDGATWHIDAQIKKEFLA